MLFCLPDCQCMSVFSLWLCFLSALCRFFVLINKVEICGVNTSKLPVLSNEEKEELLKKIKNGDKEAREKFIQGNLRLVLSVVQRFGGRGECADDLFQVHEKCNLIVPLLYPCCILVVSLFYIKIDHFVKSKSATGRLKMGKKKSLQHTENRTFSDF